MINSVIYSYTLDVDVIRLNSSGFPFLSHLLGTEYLSGLNP